MADTDAPNVYNYDPDTGELVGIAVADPSPLEPGEWLVPGYATTTTPPDVPANHVAVFDGNDWYVVEDRRGEVWWKDGEAYTITALGDPALEGLSPDGPPEVGDKEVAVWEDGQWVVYKDHRYETWWIAHGQPISIDFLGDPTDHGYFSEEPEEPEEHEEHEEPEEPEELLPNEVILPRREFRRALLHSGINTATVMETINGIEDPIEQEEMMIWWEDTQEFERSHPHLVAMTQAAGITESQADAIWAHGVDLLNGE